MNVSVDCQPRPGGWQCSVTVRDGADATHHVVDVVGDVLDELASGHTPEELVRESFVFLLEREPRESILRSFELPVIARYFPEFPDEIRRRLRRG
jgi:hypothetical protein